MGLKTSPVYDSLDRGWVVETVKCWITLDDGMNDNEGQASSSLDDG